VEVLVVLRCTWRMNLALRGFSAAAVIALIASACSPATRTPDARSSGGDVGPIGTQAFVVTRDSGEGPASCRPPAVGELMVSFLHDVNTGADPTSRFASSFQWYSMTEGNPRDGGRHFVTYKRTELDDYFDGRATHDESMKLIELSLNYETDRNISHIQYVIQRSADDTASFGTMVTGKGAIACDEGKIELLSMGMAKDIMDGIGPFCPAPDWRDRKTAVICASA